MTVPTIPANREALRAWANEHLHVRVKAYAALQLSLPGTSDPLPDHTDVALHGHWIWPVLQVLWWAEHNIGHVEASIQAATARQAYAEAMATLRTSSAERRRYQLEGKLSSAEKAARTADLFGSFKL